jgi:hypothetical protein
MPNSVNSIEEPEPRSVIFGLVNLLIGCSQVAKVLDFGAPTAKVKGVVCFVDINVGSISLKTV